MTTTEPVVITYRGQPIETMTREQLIETIHALGRQMQEAHARDMDRIEMTGMMFRLMARR